MNAPHLAALSASVRRICASGYGESDSLVVAFVFPILPPPLFSRENAPWHLLYCSRAGTRQGGNSPSE